MEGAEANESTITSVLSYRDSGAGLDAVSLRAFLGSECHPMDSCGKFDVSSTPRDHTVRSLWDEAGGGDAVFLYISLTVGLLSH